MLLVEAIGGIPGSAALADVDPPERRAEEAVGDADVDADADALAAGGTATFWLAGRRAPPPLPQPTTRTATVVATDAPVMESRCQRLSRYAGLDT